MPRRKREPTERNREWVCVLYPDNDRHIRAITQLEKNHYPAIWILHDQDLKNGLDEEKKEHWHVTFQFPNARYWQSLAKELDIEPNLLWMRKDYYLTLDDALRYMVHKGEHDKYQYSESQVKGDEKLKKQLHKACEIYNLIEDDKVDILMHYIDERSEPFTMRDFCKFANEKGFWGTVRQAGYLWGRMIDERNLEIIEEQKTKYNNPFTH